VITGIIIALPEELSTLTTKKIAPGHCEFIAANRIIAVSSAGPENARLATKQLLSRGATAIISWGCAAALNPALKPGDLTLVGNLIAEKRPLLCLRDSDWYQHTLKTLSQHFELHTGDLLESRKIVVTSTEKRALQKLTGASVLDMESYASGYLAAQAQIPFLAIRAIADPVCMDLPSIVADSCTEDGSINIIKLLFLLATRPQQLAALIKLGLHFRAATNKLKLVAKHIDNINFFEQSGAAAL